MISNNQKVAFVIGNGVSRKPINLGSLPQYGATYGCNALYRDFSPDHLISVDPNMIKEINDSEYNKNHNVWIRHTTGLDFVTNVQYLDEFRRWSSGPSALLLACGHGHGVIYILGFDFIGLCNDTKFNNVYSDTPNYKRSIQKHTYYRNWLNQTIEVVSNNKHVEFIQVIEKNGKIFNELSENSNFRTIEIDFFRKKFDIL